MQGRLGAGVSYLLDRVKISLASAARSCSCCLFHTSISFLIDSTVFLSSCSDSPDPYLERDLDLERERWARRGERERDLVALELDGDLDLDLDLDVEMDLDSALEERWGS